MEPELYTEINEDISSCGTPNNNLAFYSCSNFWVFKFDSSTFRKITMSENDIRHITPNTTSELKLRIRIKRWTLCKSKNSKHCMYVYTYLSVNNNTVQCYLKAIKMICCNAETVITIKNAGRHSGFWLKPEQNIWK